LTEEIAQQVWWHCWEMVTEVVGDRQAPLPEKVHAERRLAALTRWLRARGHRVPPATAQEQQAGGRGRAPVSRPHAGRGAAEPVLAPPRT